MKNRAVVKGVTLIEVLVSLLIFGIGAISHLTLTLQAVRRSEESYFRSQAGAIAQDAIERIHANPLAWPLAYNEAGGRWAAAVFGGSPCTSSQPCTDPAAMAAQDVVELKQSASASLQRGKLAVREHCSAQQTLPCVVVAWRGTMTDADSCLPAATAAADERRSHCLILPFWPEH